MLSVIVMIPVLVAIYFLVTKSHREAFLYVYLPTVLCLPTWSHWMIPGLPDPNFCSATVLPVTAAYLISGRRGWKFSAVDVLVVLFLFTVGYSEYTNAGWSEAQNLLFDMIAMGFLPYVLAKGIVEPNGLRIAFVRSFVWCLAITVCTTLYEFRFGFNLYIRVLGPFFPGQADGWVTTFRYGLARVAGPFAHAILAGVVLMFAVRFQLWLHAMGAWEPRLKRFHIGPFSKSILLNLTMLGGLGITLVRGPQLGAVLGGILGLVGQGKNPRLRAKLLILGVVVIGVPLAIQAWQYASVGRDNAVDSNQETAAYRKELIDKYVDIAMQHAPLGWGRSGWPKIPGMPSIDNYYLLLALMHGVYATLLLVTIIVVMMVRLYRNGMRYAPMKPAGSSLSFCLLGCYLGFMFSIATVYMGENVIPVFFLVTGFADGFLGGGGDAQLLKRTGTTVAEVALRPRFARVVA